MDRFSSIVIKVKYKKTLRRFRASIHDEKIFLDIVTLREKISSLLSFGSDVEFTLTYVDEDGDAVVLANDEDLRDISQQYLKPLRITVKLCKTISSASNVRLAPLRLPQSNPINPAVTKNVKSPPQQSQRINNANKSLDTAVTEYLEKMKMDQKLRCGIYPPPNPLLHPMNIDAFRTLNSPLNKLPNQTLNTAEISSVPGVGSARTRTESVNRTISSSNAISLASQLELKLKMHSLVSQPKLPTLNKEVFSKSSLNQLPNQTSKTKKQTESVKNTIVSSMDDTGAKLATGSSSSNVAGQNDMNHEALFVNNNNLFQKTVPQYKLDCELVPDSTASYPTVLPPLTTFRKIWRMRNNGNVAWPHGSQLQYITGHKLRDSPTVDVEIPADGLPVGDEVDIAIDLIAPVLHDVYYSEWRMASPSGDKFGEVVSIFLQVDGSTETLTETSLSPNAPLVVKNPEEITGKNLDVNESLNVDNADVSNTLDSVSNDLEDMGFKKLDSNNENDLECVSEWDDILDELRELGYENDEGSLNFLKKKVNLALF